MAPPRKVTATTMRKEGRYQDSAMPASVARLRMMVKFSVPTVSR